MADICRAAKRRGKYAPLQFLLVYTTQVVLVEKITPKVILSVTISIGNRMGASKIKD